ncbi:class I SAM-dependent methyltransferase, partial [bacterium]|nr:class I SAM-dependent methyltransferase [bacterium]
MTDDNVRQQPYQGLAPIYDYVMRHVDYGEWADYLHSLLERWAPDAQCIADLACGTGNISLELRERDYEVTGIDRSADMLRVAHGKAAGDPGVEFVERDLRDLVGLGPFDAAVCIYDSFNYLLEPEELDEALAGVLAILRPGGLFVFDICTERNSLRYFRDMRDSEQGPGFAYERHSVYEPETRLQSNHFRICFDAGDALAESHVQRIYAVAEITARIKASDFDLLDALDGFTFDSATE